MKAYLLPIWMRVRIKNKNEVNNMVLIDVKVQNIAISKKKYDII